MEFLNPTYQARAASDDFAPICLYMPDRSRSARGMSLTRYAMFRFEFGEERLRVAALARPGLLKPLADTFAGIGTGSHIQKPLIRRRILDHRFRFALHRQDHRSFVLLELLHEERLLPNRTTEVLANRTIFPDQFAPAQLDRRHNRQVEGRPSSSGKSIRKVRYSRPGSTLPTNRFPPGLPGRRQ